MSENKNNGKTVVRIVPGFISFSFEKTWVPKLLYIKKTCTSDLCYIYKTNLKIDIWRFLKNLEYFLIKKKQKSIFIYTYKYHIFK